MIVSNIPRSITDQIKLIENERVGLKNFTTRDVLKLSEDNFMVLNTHFLIDKYWYSIKDKALEVTFNDGEKAKYIYKPKLLSYDLYGTIELYPLLLRLNNMVSISDFADFNTLRIFQTNIGRVINDIIIKETKELTDNNNTVTRELYS